MLLRSWGLYFSDLAECFCAAVDLLRGGLARGEGDESGSGMSEGEVDWDAKDLRCWLFRKEQRVCGSGERIPVKRREGHTGDA